MSCARLRTLSEVKTEDLYAYMDNGFYTYYDNDDFWDNDKEERHKIVIYNIIDMGDKLIAIDRSPYTMGISIGKIPEDMSLFYKLLYNGKIKVHGTLLLDDRLDLSKIDLEHVYIEHMSLNYNERLLKYKDIMKYRIYSIEDVSNALRAKELGIPIKIMIYMDEEVDPSIEYYMDIITELYKMDIRVHEDNLLDIIISVRYKHIDVNAIISLLDMSYELRCVGDLELDVRDTNTYNRVSRLMNEESILLYCLYTSAEIPTNIAMGTGYDIYLANNYLIEQYYNRPDIMDITVPTYYVDENYHYSPDILYSLYKETMIRSINHWIILLNDHDITLNNECIPNIGIGPLDINVYRVGIARLWEQVYNIPRCVKYYLMNYRMLLPFLEPRIIPTKFLPYNGYPNIQRNIMMSDVNITCV